MGHVGFTTICSEQGTARLPRFWLFQFNWIRVATREGLDFKHLTGSKVASPRGFEPRLPP
jgi:hypothetical protein